MEAHKEASNPPDGWETHRIAQFRRFQALSLREKMHAVEAMAEVVQRFQSMRQEGAFRPGSHASELSNEMLKKRKDTPTDPVVVS
jgi:hypothetical protein